jgi:hypothetical protein
LSCSSRSTQLWLDILSTGELDLSLGDNLPDVTEVAAVMTDTSRPAIEGGSMPPDDSVVVVSLLFLGSLCTCAITCEYRL